MQTEVIQTGHTVGNMHLLKCTVGASAFGPQSVLTPTGYLLIGLH